MKMVVNLFRWLRAVTNTKNSAVKKKNMALSKMQQFGFKDLWHKLHFICPIESTITCQ